MIQLPQDEEPEIEFEHVETPATGHATEIEVTHGDRRRWPIAVAIVAAVALAVVALAVSDPSSSSDANGSSATAANGSPLEPALPDATGRVVALLGDKLVVRQLDRRSGGDLIGLVHPEGTGRVLWTTGRWVVVYGTGIAPGDTRTGTWVFDATQLLPPTFLGESLGFVPSLQPLRVWLVDSTKVREVRFDGTLVGGPFAVPGTVVGAAGAGLVLQEGGRVIWWLPDDPDHPTVIGDGRALAGAGQTVLWSSGEGPPVLTDPNDGTSFSPAVAPAAPDVAALSSSGMRYATAQGARLVFGELRGATFDVLLPNVITQLAWSEEGVLLTSTADGGLTLLDPTSGGRRILARLATAPAAIALMPESVWTLANP